MPSDTSPLTVPVLNTNATLALGDAVVNRVNAVRYRTQPSLSPWAVSEIAVFRQLTNRLSLKYQRADVERAKPFFLVCREFRRLDSRKTPTLFA